MFTWSWREQLNIPTMFLLPLLLVPSTLLDPPWTNASLWKPLVARRIIVFRETVSPILVTSQARESIAVARRILVILPESSHHRYEAVPVFARAWMCGHLPFICSAYAKKRAKLTSTFLMDRSIFFPPWYCFHLLADATHFLALWGSISLQSNKVFLGWLVGFGCNPFCNNPLGSEVS